MVIRRATTFVARASLEAKVNEIVPFPCPFRTRVASVATLRNAVMPMAQTGYGILVDMTRNIF